MDFLTEIYFQFLLKTDSKILKEVLFLLFNGKCYKYSIHLIKNS